MNDLDSQMHLIQDKIDTPIYTTILAELKPLTVEKGTQLIISLPNT